MVEYRFLVFTIIEKVTQKATAATSEYDGHPGERTGPSMSAKIININSEERGKKGEGDKGRGRAIQRDESVE